VSIYSNYLINKGIPSKSNSRHDFIMSLHREGMSDQQIADYLNDKNIKTPTGLSYYPELVFVTRRKIAIRESYIPYSRYELSKFEYES